MGLSPAPQLSRSLLILFLATLFLVALPGSPVLRAQITSGDMAANLEEATGFQKYPTYELYLEMMAGFAAAHPDICLLDTFGTSEEGRLLLALKISDQVHEDEAEPRFLYTATMHGDEVLGFPLLLRLADSLLTAYGKDAFTTGLVDRLEIWINPLSNPDGAYKGGNHTLAASIRENAHGYDLNRHFPRLSQGEADDSTGRPRENAHMMAFLQEHAFSLSANIHTGNEVVNYPWDWKAGLHPDDAWFRLISREYADEVHSVDPSYMSGFENGITNGHAWYEVQGSRQDYVCFFRGGREVTLELSFDYRLPSDQLQGYWELNRQSLLYYLAQATYGLHGRVRSLPEGTPLRARLEVLDHDDSTSVVWSGRTHGDFYRYLKGGSYDLRFTADGHVPLLLEDLEVGDFERSWLEVELEALNNAVPLASADLPLRIYPNPAREHCILLPDLPEGSPVQISLYSVAGGWLMNGEWRMEAGGIKLDLSPWHPGLYLLQLTSEKGRYSARLLVQE